MKTWHNIPFGKKIANINIGKKRIDNWQTFGTCLKTNPRICQKKGCIIGLLIKAIRNNDRQKRTKKDT